MKKKTKAFDPMGKDYDEEAPFGGVDFFLIVAGHRRYKACVDAGLYPIIPCDVVECDEANGLPAVALAKEGGER